MTKSLNNFSKYSDGALESKTHLIISSITGNAFFPTPTPALVDLQAASTAYQAALSKAGTGNRIDIAEKNAARQELVALLVILCTYVNLTANGDRIMLLSSGFDITKEREPVIIAKPQNLKVEGGVYSGQLLVSVNGVKGAKAYLHEYTTDATMLPGSWVSTPGSSSKMLFTDLQPGTKYYCRVGAVGPNSQLVYSDAVARIAP